MIVSWISFVVPPDVIPGRMALLVTLFLVLVNIFNTVTTNTPKAEGSYCKTICNYFLFFRIDRYRGLDAFLYIVCVRGSSRWAGRYYLTWILRERNRHFVCVSIISYIFFFYTEVSWSWVFLQLYGFFYLILTNLLFIIFIPFLLFIRILRSIWN